ncbi:MAG: cytochrome c [Casimicrobiaceae bacterium]
MSIASRWSWLRPALRICAVVLVVFALTPALEAAELTATIAGRTHKYTTAALLAHPAATTITVAQDVSYKKPMTYRAVPASVLLAGLPREDTVRFVAADGFAASISATLLLAQTEDAPRAYVAIEPANAPWPPLQAGAKETAGPFYLVWVRTDRGRISPEQWPYRIASIEDVAPVAVRFAGLAPTSVPANDPIRRGFAVFSASCLPCHTLNLMGDARIGPDLNVPFSATEYLREDFLRMQIRNPQALRSWPGAKMPAFDVNAITERELDELLAYLYYMARRKVEVPKG